MRPSSPSPAPSAPPQPSRLLTAYAVPGIGRITPGTDLGRELGGAIRSSGLDLKDGDVVVVASKIVAKAEGALATASSRAEVSIKFFASVSASLVFVPPPKRISAMVCSTAERSLSNG